MGKRLYDIDPSSIEARITPKNYNKNLNRNIYYSNFLFLLVIINF